jgi:hypothetical protein
MTNTEKVAYIRGLAEGLELDQDKKEVKVLNAIIDLLDDMALSLSEVKENMEDMADQIDAVDEDLGSLEDDFYDECDEDCSCEDDDDEDGECYYEVTCPNCHETICLSEDIIEDGQMECPNCGETLEFDMDEEDDCGCGCGCDCDHE